MRCCWSRSSSDAAAAGAADDAARRQCGSLLADAAAKATRNIHTHTHTFPPPHTSQAEARLEIAAAATKELLAANEALQGAKQGKAPGPIAKALYNILSPGKGKESDDGAASSPSVVY
mmetsp:Transcript_37216/g.117015  ORF Transcript_37216/g.117015 Transcript_37216/m.117015 type:complete len:118 (+) Transcript_37216:1128-1481(+)